MPELKHDTLVYQAREDYAALDSAKVVITNEDTGDIEQEFTFKYDEKDVLTYSYYGKNGGKEYAQYNNGIESYTYDNGEYSHLVNGDKDFSKYTRKAKHPQADEGMIMSETDSTAFGANISIPSSACGCFAFLVYFETS